MFIVGPGGTETSYYKTGSGSSMPHNMLQRDLPHMSYFSSCLLGTMLLSSELQNRHLLSCFCGVFQSYLQCLFLHCAFYLPICGLCIVYGQFPRSCSLGHISIWQTTDAKGTNIFVSAYPMPDLHSNVFTFHSSSMRLSLSLGWRLRSQQLFI